MMTYQPPTNTGTGHLPSFSTFSQSDVQHAHDFRGSGSEKTPTGHIPNVYPNSQYYFPGQFHTQHEYSTMTSGQEHGHYQTKHEDTSVSGSDDSDKENNDLSKTSVSPNTSPCLPKPRIWSISDIMGGGASQKMDSSVMNDSRSAENVLNS